MLLLQKCTQKDDRYIGYEESITLSEKVCSYKLAYVKLQKIKRVLG